MKKIIAGLSAMALASTMFVSSASAAVTSISLNDGTNVFTSADNIPASTVFTNNLTIDFTTAETVAVGETVTITVNGVDASTLDNGDISATLTNDAEITNLNTSASDATKLVINYEVATNDMTAGAQKITVAFDDTNSGAGDTILASLAAGNYTTKIVTPSEVGASMLYVGGANKVTVTATVEPILSMSLEAEKHTITSTDSNNTTLKIADTSDFRKGDSIIVRQDGGLTTANIVTTTISSVDSATQLTVPDMGGAVTFDGDDETVELANANAINLGVLTPDAVSTATNSVRVLTNAASGFSVQASSLNTATTPDEDLAITGTDYKITATALDGTQEAGTSFFGMIISGVTNSISAGTNTTSADEGYNNDSTSPVAISTTSDDIASGNGTTDGALIDVAYKASVSVVQEAGNYSTTVTYTVTGAF